MIFITFALIFTTIGGFFLGVGTALLFDSRGIYNPQDERDGLVTTVIGLACIIAGITLRFL